ncbi:MAG: hypothetical protein NT076_04840, partial [Candidatus Pacearchaeota archaeon]|nr:hypothetical protein [Candidatus Pacearchaeota archaeon]
ETGDTVIKEVGQEFSTRAAFPTSPIKCNFSLECIEDLIGVPESGEPRKSPELHATYVIPKIHYVDAKRAIESCLN